MLGWNWIADGVRCLRGTSLFDAENSSHLPTLTHKLLSRLLTPFLMYLCSCSWKGKCVGGLSKPADRLTSKSIPNLGTQELLPDVVFTCRLPADNMLTVVILFTIIVL
jgi:hypothetical protein